MSDKVKEFVRGTLGCECPEEVFEKIEVDPEVRVGDYTIDRRINVGDRLLIYMVDGDDLQEEDLKKLMVSGKEERDTKGFNRFRMVVLSDIDTDLEGLHKLAESYEKVHVHQVSSDSVHF